MWTVNAEYLRWCHFLKRPSQPVGSRLISVFVFYPRCLPYNASLSSLPSRNSWDSWLVAMWLCLVCDREHMTYLSVIWSVRRSRSTGRAGRVLKARRLALGLWSLYQLLLVSMTKYMAELKDKSLSGSWFQKFQPIVLTLFWGHSEREHHDGRYMWKRLFISQQTGSRVRQVPGPLMDFLLKFPQTPKIAPPARGQVFNTWTCGEHFIFKSHTGTKR